MLTAGGREKRAGHWGFWRNGNSNAEFGSNRVRELGSKTQATSGHIHARNDFIAENFGANAREIIDLGSYVQALIGWFFRRRFRNARGSCEVELGFKNLSGMPRSRFLCLGRLEHRDMRNAGGRLPNR
jgi:hypothetical protein